MGKVGSKSVESVLAKSLMYDVKHVHFLEKNKLNNLLKNKFSYQHVINSKYVYDNWLGTPIKIISLVRSPLEVNISAFFENIQVYFPDLLDKKTKIKRIKQKSMSQFFDKFWTLDHTYPINWFDNDFNKALNFDIYSIPFSENGYQIYKVHCYDILIMQTCLSNAKKQECLRSFLEDKNIFLNSSNVSDSKWYSNEYQQFKKEIKFPDTYIDDVLDSKFAKHFFTKEQIKDMKFII